MTDNTVTVQIPNETLKVSDAVQFSVADIHPASWPGLINGVLRNVNSEASRDVINKIHGILAESGQFVKDTKENRDAGKTPTSTDEAKKLRTAWHEANPAEYDRLMVEAETALVAKIKDGSFRVRDAVGPRTASLSPVESRARDLGRGEFDAILADAGIVVPKNKAGGNLAPNHKKMEGIRVQAKDGELSYADALARYTAKHGDRLRVAAEKAIAAEAKAISKLREGGTAVLDLD